MRLADLGTEVHVLQRTRDRASEPRDLTRARARRTDQQRGRVRGILHEYVVTAVRGQSLPIDRKHPDRARIRHARGEQQCAGRGRGERIATLEAEDHTGESRQRRTLFDRGRRGVVRQGRGRDCKRVRTERHAVVRPAGQRALQDRVSADVLAGCARQRPTQRVANDERTARNRVRERQRLGIAVDFRLTRIGGDRQRARRDIGVGDRIRVDRVVGRVGP